MLGWDMDSGASRECLGTERVTGMDASVPTPSALPQGLSLPRFMFPSRGLEPCRQLPWQMSQMFCFKHFMGKEKSTALQKQGLGRDRHCQEGGMGRIWGFLTRHWLGRAAQLS